MWAFYTTTIYGSPTICMYKYCDSRKAEHPEMFLEDHSGILPTDGYAVYHLLEEFNFGPPLNLKDPKKIYLYLFFYQSIICHIKTIVFEIITLKQIKLSFSIKPL